MKFWFAKFCLFIGAALLVLGGCRGEEGNRSLMRQNARLHDEQDTLEMRVEKLQEENEQLREQVETLTRIGQETRLEVLTGLDRIDLTHRTDIYDKDEDGTKETLVVYIRTADDQGDTIKIPGSVTVELWDLNAEQGNRLGRWNIQPEELKTMWASTFMTNYYRLQFPVETLLSGAEEELTLRVKFTDYLTGRVLKEQTVLEL